MDTTYWQRQGEKPLFPEIEWDKPERRDQAGTILIVGGHLHALGAPAEAFQIISEIGPAQTELALPDATKKLVGPTLPGAIFLPSTPSGELSLEGKNELLGIMNAADITLLPGDTGRNSQTTQLIEHLLSSLKTPIIITRDSLDTLISQTNVTLKRENTTIIASFAQLQKILQHAGSTAAITFQITIDQLVQQLHEITKTYPASIVTLHHEQLIVAIDGHVSTTKMQYTTAADLRWRTKYASLASCYTTWHPNKPFEALSHVAHMLSQQT